MRARDALRPLALSAAFALSGCAAHDVHEAPAAPHAATPAPLDAPAPASSAAAEPTEVLDDDDGLAEYERLLADKETRLRAAGVLLARREESKPADSRYAPPPPEPIRDEKADAAGVLGKRKDERGSGGRSATPKTRPAAGATATSPSAPPPSAPAAESAPRPTKRAERRNTTQGDAMSSAELEQPGGRCQTICDLADSTCDLESKICDLAARHPGDARYVDLCRRADEDCRLAVDACQACSP